MSYIEYRKSISNELLELSTRFRLFMQVPHYPEDGRYKENILKTVIAKSIPSGASIATGFIINENGKISNQIDILIYNNSIPPLFIVEDLVIVSSSAVLGVIEVKTKMNSRSLKDSFQKGNNTQEIVGLDKYIFNGIFSFDYQRNLKMNGLTAAEKNVFKNVNNYINTICLGKDYFSKLWNEGNHPRDYNSKYYSFYKIDDLSFGYFISNLVEDVMKQLGTPIAKDFEKYLYPIENSKEAYRLENCKIKLDANGN